jgi:hypothetical protein
VSDLLAKFFRSELGKHSLITCFLILASAAISSAAYRHAVDLSARWVRPLQPSNLVTGFCKPPEQIVGPAQLRLEDDVKTLQGRSEHHMDLIIYFYANYYRAIIMSSILGAVSGICLFYIANKGWKDASNYVVTTFVISTVIAAFFFSLIAVFKEQDNITSNKTLYLKNVALRNEILSYCATGTSGSASESTTSMFVHEIDKEMANINDIAIAMDSSRIADYGASLKRELDASKPTDKGHTAPNDH